MEIKRRDFLKAGAAVGAAAAVGVPALNAFAKEQAGAGGMGEDPGQWIPTTCQGCTQWCPVEQFIQHGRLLRVRGNQLCKANNGYACPRALLLPKMVYDPDRIKVPMKRTNPQKGRGVDPKFVPITWDEALDTIADKMLELRKNNEPHKFMYMRGRYSPTSTDLAYGTIAKIFGSPNSFSHSAICAEAEKMGPGYTEGFFGYRDYDLARTKYLLIWGCDPLSSNRQVPNAIHKFGDILDRATVAVVDPRLSSSAAKAHEWLPVKPGEDGALATAIAHVLLTEGLWSKGIYNSEPYTFKAHWGKFGTETKRFEFYSETLKKVLKEHADKHKTTIDDVLQASNYTARGEQAFVPHYEPPKRWGDEKEYPFTFIDYKSRLNREGRSQNVIWYHEFKKVDVGDVSWDDVVKINPADAQKLGIKNGDTVRLTSPTGSITVKAKLWEGLRPGTVAKCYGQGHWAYGKVAAKEYHKARPRGGNNNELMPDDYDRLSGSTARNGGFTGVKIEKV
ncbi:MAG: molybdopterin-dependent oxidoreductase [Alphaproteobacteria bacterium]|uniref:Molybdopterin-dependent oxidoreductase n=1 Tax=Candidatus Nitrobium versatile TaxID=2884831 RepID=A0A953J661_9BACT|nr:molybdopterin-dependent oxidoreductase [Candidatus Nitrobium versatile]